MELGKPTLAESGCVGEQNTHIDLSNEIMHGWTVDGGRGEAKLVNYIGELQVCLSCFNV